ncbi:MFS transporter [Aurantiacibacter sp. MUD11]|uniref:MFS transporter n=1 Tax=Aurantiacibacter sp. MUD11 TaxID=3003265 RepID=UPI0022AAB07F|nr:MFS transporter [Aurantiacibacter sp. MUD11]WAT17091.1 MFS transporter [Aurantiacibacter sp. MUD11]
MQRRWRERGMATGAQELPADDPRQVLGNRRMTLPQYGVVAICVLVNMIDGYDILAISLAGASLREAWGLSDAALGTLLAMHLVGMAVGALSVSPVADQWGRRPAILTCLILMSVGMAAAALADGYATMVAARLLTGVGIGGMTSTVGMIALEYASFRRREFSASVVASAYPVGTMIGAAVAASALQGFDWRAIFWVGAALSAVVFPIALIGLPDSVDFLLNRQPKGALEKTNRVLRRMAIPEIAKLPPKPEGSKSAVLLEIKQPMHVRELLKLFLAHALNMFAWYFILQWGPVLVSEASASPTASATYQNWFSIGGVIGGMTSGFLCGVIGVKRMMWFTMLAMAALIALFGQFATDVSMLWLLAPFIGAALFGSATANWLTIAYAFPPQLRATGLGFATTAGRVGAVGGPFVGGLLLNTRETGVLELGGASIPLTLSIAGVCLVMAVPAVLSASTFTFARRMEPLRK